MSDEIISKYDQQREEEMATNRAWREGDIRVREQGLAQIERDMAGHPVRQRAEFHHDIVKSVVIALLEGHAHDATSEMVDNAVVHAKFAADVLYPKTEG